MTDTCAQCGADFAIGDQSVQVPAGTICTKCTVAEHDYRKVLHKAYEADVCEGCNGEGCGNCHNLGEVPVTKNQYFANVIELFAGRITDAVEELERDYRNHHESIEDNGYANQARDWAKSAATKGYAEAVRLRGLKHEEVAA